MALEPAKLSDFMLGGPLGTGTTAKVYEAVHKASGRAVAIKVMEGGSSGGQEPRDVRERFAREALLLSGVESRYVGKILGFGFERGQPFLVLERLRGETLDAKLRRDGPIMPYTAFRWMEQLLVGVRACHDAKVIHRDIKPSNLFLHQEGFEESAKLIDFGVARLREISGGDRDLTGTNHMIGSMAYMAPEQFDNPKAVGFQADLYAVGVVIYRTLTGRLPFVSRSVEAVIRMKAADPPPISSLIGSLQVPRLDWFCQIAMRREPEARFQSAREMLDQWRSVMASIEEESTDILGGVGRVDESYAGPRPRPSSPEEHPANEEDRTLRQYGLPLPSGRGSVVPPRGSTPPRRLNSDTIATGPPAQRNSDLDLTLPGHRPPEPSVPTIPEFVGPRLADDEPLLATLPGVAGDDSEIPTKSDPLLRELVRKELELYRTRGPKR
jgi:serine/threonine-protein kinase